MLSKRVLYHGVEDPVPSRRALRAGPLSLIYEAGDLRYIRYGETEVLRRIYVAIRDRDWGTVPPVLTKVKIDAGPSSFRISYDVKNIQGEVDFRWHGVITGGVEGSITFEMDGAAHSEFLTSRIGFCVLHPASSAGAPCRVEHVDGQFEEAGLPLFIVPEQPLLPFQSIRALRHAVEPGVWAEVRFDGDVFEMEDQRNWTDASYKTYSTMMQLPCPVQMQPGSQIAQRISLSLIGGRGKSPGRPRTKPPLALSVGALNMALPLPLIGLGLASHGEPLSTRALERLKALRLGHLRVDVHLESDNFEGVLELATSEAEQLACPLEVALLISENGDQELSRLRAALARYRPPVRTWLVYTAKELVRGGSPITEAVASAIRHLGSLYHGARFAAGTNADFIFMQRSQPPFDLLDLAVLAANPQVHAFDDASLMETPETQATMVASARRLARGLPVAVSPITLKPRYNPYALGPQHDTAPGELPPQVDPRQMSLFCAAWTLGSLKYLAESGVHSVTYFETTGWRGIMETEAGSPLPEKFRSLPGGVFPVYHVLADIGEFAGGHVIPSWSQDPLIHSVLSCRVNGLFLVHGSQRRAVIANMSAQRQSLSVSGLGKTIAMHILDETNAEKAMQAPEAFRGEAAQTHRTKAGALSFDLRPYAVARLDWEA